MFCYPYKMNTNISNSLRSRPRERLILVYARPHAIRNAFELICESLQEWQQRDPVRAHSGAYYALARNSVRRRPIPFRMFPSWERSALRPMRTI